ncbi:MAG: hypothetical protein E4G71_00685 [Candidatus Atribacteria bacterium]|nr:MAG: hypothetical protein E4G71_00685 [Candidatus Atribacteria bacterium]
MRRLEDLLSENSNLINEDKMIDQATFDKPHQLTDGASLVFVNCVQLIKDGEHTSKFPSRTLKRSGIRIIEKLDK